MKFLLEDEEILQGQTDIFSYQDEQKAEEIYNKIKDKDSIESWFDVLVPESGKADSVAGELVRAMTRLLYRDYNDGDRFFSGYGVETCGGSAQFLMEMTNDWIASKLQEIIENDLKDDDYTDALNEVGLGLIEFLKNNKGLIIKINEEDSRDWELDEEFIPKYDFDCLIPDYICDLIDAGKYSKEDLENEIYYWEFDGLLGNEAERIYVDNDYVYIEGISEDTYDDLKKNMYRWLEHFADDLEKEYGDIFDDEYDEEDEDIDESLSKKRVKSNKFKKELDLDEALGLKEDKQPKTCVICKKEYTGYGNNAEPVAKGQCCDDFNRKVVIPARLKENKIVEKNALKEEFTEEHVDEFLNEPIELTDINGYTRDGFLTKIGGKYKLLPLDFDLRDENVFKYDLEDIKCIKVIEDEDRVLKEDTIKQNGKWVNKGKEGTHGTFRTKKEADAQRKAMFARGYSEDVNESLHNDEISDFFDKAKRLGVKTLGDLRKLLNEDPASVGNTEKEKIDAYADVVELGDDTLSNESLKEDFNKESLEQEIRKAIRQYFKNYDDDDYEEIVNDYLDIDIEDKDDRTKVEVRAELSYNSMDEIADLLNPIVQKLDKDAYFDHEDSGIINAFIRKNAKGKKAITESLDNVQGIKIPDYTNTWSSIDSLELNGKTYYLMENDTWGDETNYLVITPDFKEIYETYDDIETCLRDEGIITEELEQTNNIKRQEEIKAEIEQTEREYDKASDANNPQGEIEAADKLDKLYEDSEEDEIDALYHDASEDELKKMGAFDNLNDETYFDDDISIDYIPREFRDADVIEDDIPAADIDKLSNMAMEEQRKYIKENINSEAVAPVLNEQTLEDFSKSDDEEIVDYVSPNAVDKDMQPQEVDINKI